jgi:hypothetical protein
MFFDLIIIFDISPLLWGSSYEMLMEIRIMTFNFVALLVGPRLRLGIGIGDASLNCNSSKVALSLLKSFKVTYINGSLRCSGMIAIKFSYTLLISHSFNFVF